MAKKREHIPVQTDDLDLIVGALRSHLEALDGFLRDCDEADEVSVVRLERLATCELINRIRGVKS